MSYLCKKSWVVMKLGGGWSKTGGLCPPDQQPPGPSLKPPLLGGLRERCKLRQCSLGQSPSRS